VDSTIARIPSKQIQTKPSKNAWIYSSEAGLFNELRAKNKKIDLRLRLYSKRLKRIPSLASLPRREGRR
jgi:hypothetical protein